MVPVPVPGYLIFAVILAGLAFAAGVAFWVHYSTGRQRLQRWQGLAATYGWSSPTTSPFRETLTMSGTYRSLPMRLDREVQSEGKRAAIYTRVTATLEFPPFGSEQGALQQVLTDPRAQAATTSFLASHDKAEVTDNRVSCRVWDPVVDVDKLREAIEAVAQVGVELQQASQRVASPRSR